MRFRNFVIFYIILVTIPTLLLFLCLEGMGFEVLKFALTLIATFSIGVVAYFVATKLGYRVKKADLEEIRREDDVLLESVAFSQAILFVLLSLMETEDILKQALLRGILITTIAFYSLRAWGKIKDSPKCRYYSMIAFAFLSANTVTSALKIYFNIPDELIVDMSMIYTATATCFAYIADAIFKKRYGYEPRR